MNLADRPISSFLSHPDRVHGEFLLMLQSAFGITRDNESACDKVSTPPVWIRDFRSESGPPGGVRAAQLACRKTVAIRWTARMSKSRMNHRLQIERREFSQ